MKGATRKGTPGRPVGFVRQASAAVLFARGFRAPHSSTWSGVVEVLKGGSLKVYAAWLQRMIEEEGYQLSDPIPADLIRKGDQLRRRAARRRARKAGAR
jgi:hypothetical protein